MDQKQLIVGFGIVLMLLASACAPSKPATKKGSSEATAQAQTWDAYRGDKKASGHSSLDQINRSNVQKLERAWTYHTGDETERSNMECNPIVIGGTMYVTSPSMKVIALEAATGDELWRFDPFPDSQGRGINRGVTYWKDGPDQRILFTAGNKLYALDAKTGERISTFGDEGAVDLRTGLELEKRAEDVSRFVHASSPGVVYEDLLILGSRVREGYDSAPGDVRAFNIHTGELAWIFHTIPHPGEFGYDTWPKDAWKTAGGTNAWAGLTVDDERGLVFAPIGVPAFDFYGASRVGKNLFGNSLVALDARTGERVWHFQFVHHGLWDYDTPAPPNLVTVEHDGEQVDAVAQVTKTGFVFLFNRETGEPLFSIEERPVPQSDVPGEETWPTQPFPTKPEPFARQGFSEAVLTELTPEAHANVKERFEQMRGGPLFTPPSIEGTAMLPGTRGGANWSGASFDPTTDMLYVNANGMPNVMTLKRVEGKVKARSSSENFKDNAGLKSGYMGATPKDRYVHTGWNQFLGPNGYPAIKPPWGTLSAIDLGEGEVAWQAPLGAFPELTEKGIPPTGTQNLGGNIVTDGGLIFAASTMDEKIRAFDKRNGKVLWEAKLPAGGYASPATYRVDGKQYVVIAAGGGGLIHTETGDAYVAFALP